MLLITHCNARWSSQYEHSS